MWLMGWDEPQRPCAAPETNAAYIFDFFCSAMQWRGGERHQGGMCVGGGCNIALASQLNRSRLTRPTLTRVAAVQCGDITHQFLFGHDDINDYDDNGCNLLSFILDLVIFWVGIDLNSFFNKSQQTVDSDISRFWRATRSTLNAVCSSIILEFLFLVIVEHGDLQ